MKLYTIIDKFCGTPTVRMATPDYKLACDAFIALVNETEASP